MKLECHCGNLILNISDANSAKAHFICDELWSNLFDSFDDQILKPLESGRITEEAASMALRTALIQASRPIYQCPACGRLWVDDPAHEAHSFLPESDATPRDLLQGPGRD
jgi:hypothetical protein